MKHIIIRYTLIVGLAAIGVVWNGEILPISGDLVAIAEARRGRPATPVSYAGVARRSTVRAGAPGVGARPKAGAGAGAPGVGVTPGVGTGTRGVGAGTRGVGVAPGNRGGPVNRVGVR